jgi:hypothetical protein
VGHRRIVTLVLFACAAFMVIRTLGYVTDLLLYPWALAQPSVMGRWAGRLTPVNGVQFALSLELRRAHAAVVDDCTTCNQLEGTAVTCDGQGVVRRYRLSGSPDDRRATRLHLGAVPDAMPPPDGLELSTVNGAWDGQDAMAMEADFFWRRGVSAVSSTDDPATQPVPVRLERAGPSAFEALCAALRRSS